MYGILKDIKEKSLIVCNKTIKIEGIRKEVIAI